MRISDKYRYLGIKLTPQRLAILSYLDGNRSHPSAEDIYRSVRKEFPTMSVSTVYNTLDVLKENGDVQELTIDPRKKRYGPVNTPHNHLMCNKCRHIVDINKEFKFTLPSSMTEGFELTGNHVEFFGFCSNCRKKQ